MGSVHGWGKSPEEELVTHSSILAWRLSWTEDPVRLQSTVLQEWTQLCDGTHTCARTLPRPVFLIFLSVLLRNNWHTAPKSLQSCPTLCDPTDSSPPGSPVPGILQARTLEWVAISFSNAWKWIVKVKSFSHARLLATPWTAAYQAPLFTGFSRQECWSGVPPPSLNWHTSLYKF